MERISWKEVRYNDRSGNIPSLRWGHSCCLIDDEVVYFGGYADSNYMNDVWSFNTITMEWKEIHTTGDVPSHRSNCSMSYDQINNRIIVFGGGGPNKKRFNSINILDWTSKIWHEILPNTNEPVPWERTYHTAQLFYPYLVIFGGEGVSDLDDLWIFDLISLSWKEVKIDAQGVKPCPRRFHSSAKINNQMFVIAGCHSKYRCLSDIYSIDLTNYFQDKQTSSLQWRQRKLKDNTFLTRWGHTSVVYDQKIYVYGGRFCNDLSDILVLDCQMNRISTLKVYGQPPKARRRHSACFLGSNMLIFGGFNGEYFNDLHYINISTSKKKNISPSGINNQMIDKILNLKGIQFKQIKTIDNKLVKVCIQLLLARFKSSEQCQQFLQSIQGKYSHEQLSTIMITLYKGYGKIDPQLFRICQIELYQSKEEYDQQFKRKLLHEQKLLIIGNRKRIKQTDPVIYLDDELYSQFLQSKRSEESKYNIKVNANNQIFKASPVKLAINSKYFSCVISGSYCAEDGILIPVQGNLVFQTLLYYLTTNFVIVYKQIDHKFWIKLTQLAEYFCINNLLNICQSQLISYVNQQSCQELLVVSLNYNLNNLSRVCSEQIIKNMVNKDLDDYNDIFPQLANQSLGLKRQTILKQTYGELRFDILQRKIDFQYRSAKNSTKTIDSEGDRQQKQNYQTSN